MGTKKTKAIQVDSGDQVSSERKEEPAVILKEKTSENLMLEKLVHH